eukprot:TRINITY_DN22420_c0_g1_i1.p1 TRINITY_DN22420_c0_g1~~TRINITY_DN22420_c0_g1_i1.p1  ORF type:complete len:239 (-),score=39.29 TRINITY_DN22420_c0_g1_i1:408-1124(-)
MDEKFHREHIERTRLDVLARNVGVGVDEEQIDGAFEQVNPFNQSKPFFTRGKAHHFLNDSHGARKLLAPETLEPLYDPDYRKAIMTTRQAANWWDRNGGEGGGGGGGGGGAGDGGATDTLVLPVEERLATGSKYSARSVRSASTGAPPPSLPGSPQQHGGSVSSRADMGASTRTPRQHPRMAEASSIEINAHNVDLLAAGKTPRVARRRRCPRQRESLQSIQTRCTMDAVWQPLAQSS